MSMSKLVRELQNTKSLESVKQIQFGVMSPDEIRNGSVCEILTPDTYDGSRPKIGGLFDQRMGIIDNAMRCFTDEQESELCPGYFGHIELGLPVFNYNFLPYVEKLLRCVCFRCSNILIDKNDPDFLKELKNKTGKERFLAIVQKSAKIKKCMHNNGCYVLQPVKYQRKNAVQIKDNDNIVKIYGEFSHSAFKDSRAKKTQEFSPDTCYNIFRKITDEDVEFLGFSAKYSRPEWLICTVLPVPPPSVRPSVRADNNQRSEDDLTYALASIIKANKGLKQKITAKSNKMAISSYQGLLQYHVATYMDNEIPGVPPSAQRSMRPLKALAQRLKAKGGRMRGNIEGKRVDFSARTVISVDPNINIDEYGVPRVMAMNLTFPDIVTKYNINKLTKLVRTGPNKYPGAKTVTKMTTDCNGIVSPCSVYLKYADTSTIKLELGDIVHRHLQDGDIALFNRQPSLHRMSMMAHRIRVVEYNTFRLNVTVCKPYNADFDGDEMNMHVPQSIQTVEELKQLTLVPTQIISPGNCKPIIYIVQDTLIGAYLMTLDNNRIDKKLLCNMLMHDNTFNGNFHEVKNKNEWTGKQAYSIILPTISLKCNINDDLNTVIKNGELKTGYLSKAVLGPSASGLIHTIYNRFGEKRCSKFLNDTQNIVTRWLTNNSFSLGLGDTIILKDTQDNINELINDGLNEVNELLIASQEGVYQPNLDKKYLRESLEAEISGKLAKISNSVSKYLMKTISHENGIYKTVTSGSKGAPTNVQQIMGLLGAQDIWGIRVPDGFTDRTLPHFTRYDISASAKGFCKNSFINGLTPTEVFFHAMSGRNGVIDTAIKTAESGYISRKFIKATEDLKANYDGTVRNAMGNIVQFTYGDDMFDPTKLEKTKIELIEKNNRQMKDMYHYNNKDKEYWSAFLTKDAIDELVKIDGYEKQLDAEYDELYGYRNDLRYKYFKNVKNVGDTSTYIPVNLYRLIPTIIDNFNIKKYSLSNITPIYVIEKVNNMMIDIVKYMPEKEDALIIPKIIFKSWLSSKRVICEFRFSKDAFDYIIEAVKHKVLSSIVHAGEMVGIIASQTLGEISTQMTLNTFHLAGVGSIALTEGVPRLREIINITKSSNMKVRSMTIYLKDNSKKNAELIKKEYEYTKLIDIIEKSEIIFEGKKNSKEEDIEFLNIYSEFRDIFGYNKYETESLSPWVLRLVFDKEILMAKNITMLDIQDTILNNSQCNSDNDIQPIFNDDNSGELVLRLMIKHESSENYINFMKDLEKCAVDLTLRGISNIEKIVPEAENIIKYLPDGTQSAEKEWVLKTHGSNMLDILQDDAIDKTRTTTNDILEIWEIFGIEAAREKIYQELKEVFEKSSPPNLRHVQIMADVMTYRGKLMQIDRHGINRAKDTGPIAKASFEEIMNIFIKASVFSEKDHIRGVSANVMAGQFCKCGTNNFQILIDEEAILGKPTEKDFSHLDDNFENIIEKSFDLNDAEIALSKAYEEVEDNENIKDASFKFGFNIDNMQSHKINGTTYDSTIKIIDKGGKVINRILNKNKNKDDKTLNNININEPNIELKDELIEEPNESEDDNIVEKIDNIEEEESDKLEAEKETDNTVEITDQDTEHDINASDNDVEEIIIKKPIKKNIKKKKITVKNKAKKVLAKNKKKSKKNK